MKNFIKNLSWMIIGGALVYTFKEEIDIYKEVIKEMIKPEGQTEE